jgi:uncharacterized protein involved in exopolysaccharide biosynthesis
MNAATAVADDRESSDLVELLQILWMRRKWIASCAILFAVVAGIIASLMTPIYRSSTVLIPAETDNRSLSGTLGNALGSLGGLAELANLGRLGATGAKATQEALAVLRSRQFADEFIADRQLMPLFFPSKWDSERQQWKGPPSDHPTAYQAFTYFDRRVRYVVQDGITSLVTLQIDWEDPHLAASWANELVQRLNAEMQRRAILQADASIGFLEKELERTNVVETRVAINRLIETQINQRMMANVTEQFAFRVVDRAQPPDPDDMLRPRKLVMVVIGGCLGVLLSSVFILLARGLFGRARFGRSLSPP